MSKITEEITFTPGRLAKKLGISKSKLMKHLRETGLIDQCFLTQRGHWKIPYSLAARISSVEALSLPSVNKTEGEGRKHKKANNTAQSQVPFQNRGTPTAQPSYTQLNAEGFTASPKIPVQPLSPPNYAQIGRTLRQAGVTMPTLLKYIEQQMEVESEIAESKLIDASIGTLISMSKGDLHEQSPYNHTKQDEIPTTESKATDDTNTDISNSSSE